MQISLGHLADGIVDPLPQRYAEIAISGLTADSREVLPGFVFAALAGTQADGARYIADAVSRGAAAVLAGRDTTVPRLAAPNPMISQIWRTKEVTDVLPLVPVTATPTLG